MRFTIRQELHFIRFYPPYLGSGIAVDRFDDTINSITIRMKLHFWNRNYVGTHFGGSLYSMCDPWYMFILIHHLGPKYVVWDKSANIDFVSPGKGTMYATFEISPQKIIELQDLVKDGEKHLPVFTTQVIDSQGTIVANIEKTVYIRKKKNLKNKPKGTQL